MRTDGGGKGSPKLECAGKSPGWATLQDLLVYALKGLSLYALEGRKVGVNDPKGDVFTVQALFSTLTNVDFDPERFVKLLNQGVEIREALKAKVKAAGGNVNFDGPASFKPEKTLEGLVAQGEKVGLQVFKNPERQCYILSCSTLCFSESRESQPCRPCSDPRARGRQGLCFYS